MVDSEKVKKAKELKESGLSISQIGEYLGVHKTTVWEWLHQEYIKQKRENPNKHRRAKPNRTIPTSPFNIAVPEPCPKRDNMPKVPIAPLQEWLNIGN